MSSDLADKSNECLLDLSCVVGTDFPCWTFRCIEACSCFAICYSMNDARTFREVAKYFRLIISGKDSDSAHIPIILVANSSSLHKDSPREVSEIEGVKLALKYNVLYAETSSATGHNIQETFFTLVRNTPKRCGDRKYNIGLLGDNRWDCEEIKSQLMLGHILDPMDTISEPVPFQKRFTITDRWKIAEEPLDLVSLAQANHPRRFCVIH